jgi:DNA-binding NarL/FixJ family response regulator
MAPRGGALVDQVRVLVVDDQVLFRGVMTSVVDETEGFAVVGCAGSGEESLVACTALMPDLVLMDVNLRGIDGMEATRRMMANASPPAVVLLSTYDEDDWGGQAQECGAVAYVPKAALAPDRLAAVWAGSRT